MKFWKRLISWCVNAFCGRVTRELNFCLESLERREMLASDLTYDPAVDPQVGFNMASFAYERGIGSQNWTEGVQSLYDTGAREVTFAVVRQLDGDRGRFQARSGPRLAHIRAAVRHASNLGMAITLMPLFEVSDAVGGDNYWRGDYDPAGKSQQQFHDSFRRLILNLARLAERYDASRLNVGSELQAMVRNPTNEEFFTRLIEDVGKRFDGSLGYAANWTNFDHPSVAQLFWSNPDIDYIGISAYFSHQLANVAEADNSANDPAAFEQLMMERWTEIIDHQIVPYADSLRGGNGLAIVIQEFGATPHNRSSVVPWSVAPEEATGGSPESIDTLEQTAVIFGLLRALDGRQDKIASVHIWGWSFDSNRIDVFGLDPNYANNSQATAIRVQAFLQSQSGDA